jgi:hypothetical protein
MTAKIELKSSPPVRARAEVLELRRLEQGEELLKLGLSLPSAASGGKVLLPEPGAFGMALRRLLSLGGGTADPAALILPDYRVLVDGFNGLRLLGFHPDKLGSRTIDGVITLIWGFAREPQVSFGRYTADRLLTSAGLENQFRGFLVQRVITYHPEVRSRLGAYSALGTGLIDELAKVGQAGLVNGLGGTVVLPPGRFAAPRMGVDVQTYVGGEWLDFWDVITFSEFAPKSGPGSPHTDYFWPARVEIKAAKPETRQIRRESARLLEADMVRWTDVDSGQLIQRPPQHIYPSSSPHARQLLLGRLRDSGLASGMTGEEVSIRQTRSGQDYLRYDMRLEMVWINAIIKLIMH